MNGLREAAEKIRTDANVKYGRGHIPYREATFLLAVADWLDTAGADLWAHGPLCVCDDGCNECDDELWAPNVRRAQAVAHAYLGGAA